MKTLGQFIGTSSVFTLLAATLIVAVVEYGTSRQVSTRDHAQRSSSTGDNRSTNKIRIDAVSTYASEVAYQVNSVWQHPDDDAFPQPSRHATEEEKLSWARNALEHGNESQKLSAIALLIKYSPAEAASTLRILSASASTDAVSADVIAEGLFYLTSTDNSAITNTDLKNFYARGDAGIQKAAAHLLSLRGDPSLARSYIDTLTSGLDVQVPRKRVETLYEIASIGTFDAIPYFVDRLKDRDPEVRMVSLLLLDRYGSIAEVAAVESLRGDDIPGIRTQAELIAAGLWKKNIAGLYSTEQHSLPP